MRSKFIFIGLVLLFLFTPCLAKASMAKAPEEPALAYTKFGIDLIGKLLGNKGQNIFISPASVAFALAMTYNGAAGDTRQAMANTLEVQGLSLEALNRGNARLRQALSQADPSIELTLANSLWLQQGFSFKPEFLQRNKEFYGAHLQDLDFRAPGASAAINAWVAKETHGKIKGIVNRVQPPLILINALYFKGAWTRPFNQGATRELPFHLLNGSQKRLPMMAQSGEFKYYRGRNFQAISLPYGKTGRFAMKVFLPDQSSSLPEFCRQLQAADWQKWQAEFKQAAGSLKLPRFKLEYGVSLKKPLKALGMAVAFEPRRADFSNLCPPPGVYIDDVRHKTFVEVNEAGTEAAAATAVSMLATSAMPPKQTFNMVVDRPFFVAIDDRETGAPLFMGAVFEPQ